MTYEHFSRTITVHEFSISLIEMVANATRGLADEAIQDYKRTSSEETANNMMKNAELVANLLRTTGLDQIRTIKEMFYAGFGPLFLGISIEHWIQLRATGSIEVQVTDFANGAITRVVVNELMD